jgi:hypothetical protein
VSSTEARAFTAQQASSSAAVTVASSPSALRAWGVGGHQGAQRPDRGAGPGDQLGGCLRLPEVDRDVRRIAELGEDRGDVVTAPGLRLVCGAQELTTIRSPAARRRRATAKAMPDRRPTPVTRTVRELTAPPCRAAQPVYGVTCWR